MVYSDAFFKLTSCRAACFFIFQLKWMQKTISANQKWFEWCNLRTGGAAPMQFATRRGRFFASKKYEF
jgi:hypothetical protein